MNSVRCVECSLLNFASAEVCKRCGSPLTQSEAAEPPGQQFQSYDNQANSAGFQQTQETAWQTYPGYQYPAETNASGNRKGTLAVALAVLCMVALIGIPLYLKYGRSAPLNLSWREFKPEDGSYSIQVPGEPKMVSKSEQRQSASMFINMGLVEVDEGRAAFTFGYAQYQPVQPNVPVDMLFEQAIQSLATRSGMLVLSRKSIMLGQYQGIEVEVKPPANVKKDNDRGAFRIYWVPPRVYMIGAGGPNTTEHVAARAKFLDSFKLSAGS